MISERSSIGHRSRRLTSPAGVGDLGGEPSRSARRGSPATRTGLVAACGAGNDREIAARQVPCPREQLQQRLVGAPVPAGAVTETFSARPPSAARRDAEQTIGLRPRRQADRHAQAVARQCQRAVRQGIRTSDRAETTASGSGSPAKCRSRRDPGERIGSAAAPARSSRQRKSPDRSDDAVVAVDDAEGEEPAQHRLGDQQPDVDR